MHVYYVGMSYVQISVNKWSFYYCYYVCTSRIIFCRFTYIHAFHQHGFLNLLSWLETPFLVLCALVFTFVTLLHPELLHLSSKYRIMIVFLRQKEITEVARKNKIDLRFLLSPVLLLRLLYASHYHIKQHYSTICPCFSVLSVEHKPLGYYAS